MRSKANSRYAFNQVMQEYGIPEYGIHTDNAGEELGAHTEWDKVKKHFLITQTMIEPHSSRMNKAESKIRHLKTHYWRVMNWHQCPESLWCFGMDYTSNLRQKIVRP